MHDNDLLINIKAKLIKAYVPHPDNYEAAKRSIPPGWMQAISSHVEPGWKALDMRVYPNQVSWIDITHEMADDDMGANHRLYGFVIRPDDGADGR